LTKSEQHLAQLDTPWRTLTQLDATWHNLTQFDNFTSWHILTRLLQLYTTWQTNTLFTTNFTQLYSKQHKTVKKLYNFTKLYKTIHNFENRTPLYTKTIHNFKKKLNLQNLTKLYTRITEQITNICATLHNPTNFTKLFNIRQNFYTTSHLNKLVQTWTTKLFKTFTNSRQLYKPLHNF